MMVLKMLDYTTAQRYLLKIALCLIHELVDILRGLPPRGQLNVLLIYPVELHHVVMLRAHQCLSLLRELVVILAVDVVDIDLLDRHDLLGLDVPGLVDDVVVLKDLGGELEVFDVELGHAWGAKNKFKIKINSHIVD